MQENINLILYFSTFLFILFLCYSNRSFSKKYNLYDIPDERKKHKAPVSYMGGMILALTILFFMPLTSPIDQKYDFVLIYSILIAFVGFVDDRYNLNVGGKLALQILPIYLIINSGVYIETIGIYFNKNFYLGNFFIIFNIFLFYVFINAYNYSDGTDGNIIVQFISFLILIKIKYNSNLDLNLILNFLFISIFTLYIFNITNTSFKIFLGNSGSLMLGFLTLGLCIAIYKNTNDHPIIYLWFTSYIIYEFCSTTLSRIIKNKKIFSPGRDHMHYLLNKKFKNNYLVTIILGLFNLILGILGSILYSSVGPELSLMIYFILFFIYFFFREKINN